MSEEVKVGDAAPVESSNAGMQEDLSTGNAGDRDKVKYETYSKTVGRLKKREAEFDELKSKYTEMEQEKLIAEDKKDELIDVLRKQNQELNSKYSEAVGGFARTKAYDVIVDEAVKMGCVSTNLLKKVVDDQLSTLEYDEGFVPNRDQVRNMLEGLKRDEPSLFPKDGPKIASHTLQSTNFSAGDKPVKDMSAEELNAAFHSSLRK